MPGSRRGSRTRAGRRAAGRGGGEPRAPESVERDVDLGAGRRGGVAGAVGDGERRLVVPPEQDVGELQAGLDRAGRQPGGATLPARDKPELTRYFEALIEPPGFTGRAPGGPSRWSTERSGEWQPLRPELVVEVRYDQVTDARFRHGTTLLRWRPDKKPRQCNFDQLPAPRGGALDLLEGASRAKTAAKRQRRTG